MLHRHLIRAWAPSTSAATAISRVTSGGPSSSAAGGFTSTSALRQATSFTAATATVAPTFGGTASVPGHSHPFGFEHRRGTNHFRGPANFDIDEEERKIPEMDERFDAYRIRLGKGGRPLPPQRPWVNIDNETGRPKVEEIRKMKTLSEFTVEDAEGKSYNFGEHHKDRAVLVVNTASRDEHSKENYTFLNEMVKKYKAQGLDVVAFPCNSLGAGAEEEPGTAAEVAKWAQSRHKIQFPILEKVDVNAKFRGKVEKHLAHKKESDAYWEFKREQDEKWKAARGEPGTPQREKWEEQVAMNEHFIREEYQMPRTQEQAEGATWAPDGNEHRLYTWLKMKTKNSSITLTENFTYFLCNKEGKPLARFDGGAKDGKRVEEAIQHVIEGNPGLPQTESFLGGCPINRALIKEREEKKVKAQAAPKSKFRGKYAKMDMTNYSG